MTEDHCTEALIFWKKNSMNKSSCICTQKDYYKEPRRLNESNETCNLFHKYTYVAFW